MKKVIQKINVFQKINDLTQRNEELTQKINVSQKNNKALLQFLSVEKVDLKFAFDQIKSYAIASSVMVLGFYLGKNPQPMFDGLNFSLDKIWALILIALGFILNILSFMQLALALTKFKIGKIAYVIIGLFLFFLTSKLFMSDFFKTILNIK